MINNSDGTISLEDATTYDQVGSNFGAGQLNATNQAVNESLDKNKVVRDLETIGAITEEGYVPDALALKEVNDSIEQQPAFIYDENGQITGYKTKVGADTVFPFSSGVSMAKQDSGSYTTINAEQTITTNLNKINFLITWWANGAGTELVWLNGEPYGKTNNTLKVNGNTFSHKSGNIGYVLNWLVLGE